MIALEKLREALKVAPKDDIELQSLLDEVVDLWEECTGRKWSRREDHVEILHPATDQSEVLFLELWPVESITSVEVRELDATSEWETLDSSSYRVEFGNVLRKLGVDAVEGIAGKWWRSDVRVTYTGGYSPTTGAPTPGDVQRAIITQIRFMKARLDDAKLTVKSQNFEGGAGVFEDAWLHPTFRGLAKRRARKA